MPQHTAIIESFQPFFTKLERYGVKVAPGFIKGKRGNSEKRIKLAEVVSGFKVQIKDASGVQELTIYQSKDLSKSEIKILVEKLKQEFGVL